MTWSQEKERRDIMSVKINYPNDEAVYDVEEYFNKNVKEIEDEVNDYEELTEEQITKLMAGLEE